MFHTILFQVFPGLFCHFFSLMSVKSVSLSKKKLYSAVPGFFALFMWTGRYLSYPEILSLCSYKGCLLSPFLICHYTFSVLCGLVVVCPYMLYLLYFIWFGVQGGKSTHSCATEGLCPCSCGLRSVTAVPECLYPHREAHASEQGWKTASSTAPFLNASQRILDMWLLLCPLLWSSLLHSCNLVGNFLLCTFLPKLNSTVHGALEYPTDLSELFHSWSSVVQFTV